MIPGNICTSKKENIAGSLPLNLKRLKAYAAGTAKAKPAIVVPIDTIRELVIQTQNWSPPKILE